MIGRASGRWSIQVTRRFQNSDGSFGGVVVASLNPDHFTKFYDRIDFGSSVSISLIGSDGFVRSSGGSGDGFALGQDLGGTKLFSEMHKGANTTFEYSRSFRRPDAARHPAQGGGPSALGERQHRHERDLQGVVGRRSR